MSGEDRATYGIPLVKVNVQGDFNAGSASRIQRVLLEAVSLRPRNLVVDLARCPSIDAIGIMLLLDTCRRAMHIGGQMALHSPSPQLARSLRLAEVDRILPLIDEAAA